MVLGYRQLSLRGFAYYSKRDGNHPDQQRFAIESNIVIARLRKVLAELQDDTHYREFAFGAVLAFFLKAIGAAIVFGLNVAIARLIGADGAGLYFVSLAVVSVASVVSRLGFDNALLRAVSTYVSKDNWDDAVGVFSVGIRLVAGLSVLVSAALFFGSPLIAEKIFLKTDLAEPLRWMSLSIAPFALLNLYSESLKGLKRIRDAMFIQGISYPLIALALVYPLGKAFGASGVAIAYTCAVSLTLLFAILIWRHRTSKRENSKHRYPLRKIWKSAWPLYKASLVNHALLPWLPFFVLGIWATNEEVGVFGAATRVALLISFLTIAVNNVVAPKFAELFSKSDYRGLGLMARRSAATTLILTAPVIITLLLLPELVMTIFGREFSTGGLVLQILVIGRTVNLLAGSAGHVLIMSGNEESFAKLTVASAVVQIALCFLLIPRFGPIGAAFSASVALAGQSVAIVWAVKMKLGIEVIPFLSMGDDRQNSLEDESDMRN